MHGKHRSPADRSAPAGASAAHSGYRSFGRGVGGGYRRGGQPKPSSNAAPRHRTDVLLEAGRLAAEYLVAKGLLPASSLPPPPPPPPPPVRLWPNGDGGGEGGRTSALSRLGRRRFDDDDVGFEAKSHKGRGGKRRNRNGSYSRHGSDWGRENGTGEPWPDTWTERGRGYSDAMEGGDFDRLRRWTERGRGFMDTMGGEDSDRRGGFEDAGRGNGSNGGGEPSKVATADEQSVPSKSEVTGESETEPESRKFVDNNGAKAMVESGSKADLVLGAEENLNRRSDDVRVSDLEVEEAGEVKESVESGARGEAEQNNGWLQEELGDLAAQPCPGTEDKQASNHGINLLSLCGFPKVPTKHRSFVAHRSPKTDQTLNTEGKGTNHHTSTGVFGAKTEEVPTLSPSSDTLTDQPHSSSGVASETSTMGISSDSLTGQPRSSRAPVPGISGTQSAPLHEESVEHDLMSSVGSMCTRSDSFPESPLGDQQQETSQGPPGFELSGKLLDARMDEALLEHVKREGMRRQREWSPSILPQTDEYFGNLRAKPPGLPAEKILPDHKMVEAEEEEQLRDADAFPKVMVDSSTQLEKERQLASSSFKICDLNLMEAPEVTDVSDDRVLERLPTTAPLLSGNNLSMDFGLSIGQRCNGTDGYAHSSSIDKVVPVIDVEDDSPVQVTACDSSKAETEPAYPNLENFLNHPENPVDLPDIQDGYGLAISEFLGNDIAGCPAVQGDISNLQTGMPFHGAEGITGVDDSLYVSLGEIPIGFMDVWDQPPPEYGKFF
uniref:Uncharacterized protein At4g26450 n=1 Tax=Anthurium amnicola TaxID=1678845 RepID=A0A1D1ZJE2_9ARAE